MENVRDETSHAKSGQKNIPGGGNSEDPKAEVNLAVRETEKGPTWLKLTCFPQTQRAELGLVGEKYRDDEERTWPKPEPCSEERGRFGRECPSSRSPCEQSPGHTYSGLLPRRCQDFVILSHPFVLSKIFIFFCNFYVCTEGSLDTLQTQCKYPRTTVDTKLFFSDMVK